ncbi:MAG: hypothetical protein HN712_14930 [Gemmatimonadetes bacterium]|nr:hypothetical protein [Gemmatimonadota bacterium]MBT7861613.1 hypothetical protein [Gemmatimonadota bacterium]
MSRSTAQRIDAPLRAELWRRIAVRLADGEPLATHEQLLAALEAAYREFTGQALSEELRRHLRRHVRQVNDEQPEAYLARGVQNAVQQAFTRGVENLRWEVGHVEQHGTGSIRRFLRRERIRDFLLESQLDPGHIDVAACVRHGVAWARAYADRVSGGAQPSQDHARVDLQTEDLDAAQLLLTIQAGLAPAEARRRLTELERLRRELHERIAEQLANTIETYVEDGVVSADEADRYRVQAEAGNRTIAEPSGAAVESDARLPDAVADTVSCLQVFRSLQRIGDDFDGLFRTLIEHKELVIGGDDDDRTHLMTALLGNPGFLELAVSVMGRRDPELRLLAARAAPYDRLPPDAPVEAPTIETSFVDDMRSLCPEDYALRLYSTDRTTRTRARGDLYNFILLLDRLIEATPFRRKMRLLIANRILTEHTPEIEAIYRSGKALSDSRARAEHVLNQQLRLVFVEASPEESRAMQRRRQGLLMTIEQRLGGTASEEADLIMAPLLNPDQNEDEAAATVEPQQQVEELSDVERSRGALLADVEIRVDGQRTTVPGVVMPSPEDSQRMVLVERDAQTGELAPQMRRGRPRYVNRRPDGSWQALTG